MLPGGFSILIFSLAIALPALVVMVFLAKLLLHSRSLKRKPWAAGLVGLRGRAHSEITGEGLVFVRGELWPARSKTLIERGATVLVKGFSGLALEVEPD